MKDNFSQHADRYARYRPDYPAELFHYIESLVPARDHCWDCGTGNGQLAARLAGSFRHVYATDISSTQIARATNRPNIQYSVQPAERTHFENEFFDLVAVGQAIHWFDFAGFYKEVKRTCKPGALLVVAGYGLIRINKVIDRILTHFYKNTLGPYWDPERRYIEEEYRTIPFPFKEVVPPYFSITSQWTLEHFIGYLATWSAVSHYTKAKGINPVDQLVDVLSPHWPPGAVRDVKFPLLLRIGEV